MRHYVESIKWKKLNEEHFSFARDAWNVHHGLVLDGFNPFNNMAKPYGIANYTFTLQSTSKDTIERSFLNVVPLNS